MSPFFVFSGFFFMFLSFVFSLSNFSVVFYWNIFSDSFCFMFPIYLDYISCLFMSVVLIISGSIVYYSEYYMSDEIFKSRFFYLMLLFVFSMIFLILSPNFFSMLLGWDGLGLISYCLVIFYNNFKSSCSGMITAITNRIGDVFIIGSICLFFFFGDFNYMYFTKVYDLNFLMIFFFFVASMTKSAQIPFSAWLPAAMAAPTPVSSLVHSSTLVTAGVYIMIRFSYFLKGLSVFILFISLLTMIMSGLSGLVEYDMKKVIALSTLSQLGFMMSSIGLSYFDLAFFHLIIHAGFKALLFMCSGIFIHSLFNVQDIRYCGFLNKDFFWVLCMFNVSNLSLCGFPFLSGFFSKDLILEMVLMSDYSVFGYIYMFMYMFGTFLTVFYSFRLSFFLTFKEAFIFKPCYMNLDFNIHKSLFILFFFSISLGYLSSMLYFFPYNYICLPFHLKILIILICLLSFLFCKWYSFFHSSFKGFLLFFFINMWYLTFLKTDFLKLKSLNHFYKLYKSKIGYNEMFLSGFYMKTFFFISSYFSNIQTFFFFFFFSLFFFLMFLFMVFM